MGKGKKKKALTDILSDDEVLANKLVRNPSFLPKANFQPVDVTDIVRVLRKGTEQENENIWEELASDIESRLNETIVPDSPAEYTKAASAFFDEEFINSIAAEILTPAKYIKLKEEAAIDTRVSILETAAMEEDKSGSDTSEDETSSESEKEDVNADVLATLNELVDMVVTQQTLIKPSPVQTTVEPVMEIEEENLKTNYRERAKQFRVLLKQKQEKLKKQIKDIGQKMIRGFEVVNYMNIEFPKLRDRAIKNIISAYTKDSIENNKGENNVPYPPVYIEDPKTHINKYNSIIQTQINIVIQKLLLTAADVELRVKQRTLAWKKEEAEKITNKYKKYKGQQPTEPALKQEKIDAGRKRVIAEWYIISEEMRKQEYFAVYDVMKTELNETEELLDAIKNITSIKKILFNEDALNYRIVRIEKQIKQLTAPFKIFTNMYDQIKITSKEAGEESVHITKFQEAMRLLRIPVKIKFREIMYSTREDLYKAISPILQKSYVHLESVLKAKRVLKTWREKISAADSTLFLWQDGMPKDTLRLTAEALGVPVFDDDDDEEIGDDDDAYDATDFNADLDDDYAIEQAERAKKKAADERRKARKAAAQAKKAKETSDNDNDTISDTIFTKLFKYETDIPSEELLKITNINKFDARQERLAERDDKFLDDEEHDEEMKAKEKMAHVKKSVAAGDINVDKITRKRRKKKSAAQNENSDDDELESIPSEDEIETESEMYEKMPLEEMKAKAMSIYTLMNPNRDDRFFKYEKNNNDHVLDISYISVNNLPYTHKLNQVFRSILIKRTADWYGLASMKFIWVLSDIDEDGYFMLPYWQPPANDANTMLMDKHTKFINPLTDDEYSILQDRLIAWVSDYRNANIFSLSSFDQLAKTLSVDCQAVIQETSSPLAIIRFKNLYASEAEDQRQAIEIKALKGYINCERWQQMILIMKMLLSYVSSIVFIDNLDEFGFFGNQRRSSYYVRARNAINTFATRCFRLLKIGDNVRSLVIDRLQNSITSFGPPVAIVDTYIPLGSETDEKVLLEFYIPRFSDTIKQDLIMLMTKTSIHKLHLTLPRLNIPLTTRDATSSKKVITYLTSNGDEDGSAQKLINKEIETNPNLSKTIEFQLSGFLRTDRRPPSTLNHVTDILSLRLFANWEGEEDENEEQMRCVDYFRKQLTLLGSRLHERAYNIAKMPMIDNDLNNDDYFARVNMGIIPDAYEITSTGLISKLIVARDFVPVEGKPDVPLKDTFVNVLLRSLNVFFDEINTSTALTLINRFTIMSEEQLKNIPVKERIRSFFSTKFKETGIVSKINAVAEEWKKSRANAMNQFVQQNSRYYQIVQGFQSGKYISLRKDIDIREKNSLLETEQEIIDELLDIEVYNLKRIIDLLITALPKMAFLMWYWPSKQNRIPDKTKNSAKESIQPLFYSHIAYSPDYTFWLRVTSTAPRFMLYQIFGTRQTIQELLFSEALDELPKVHMAMVYYPIKTKVDNNAVNETYLIENPVTLNTAYNIEEFFYPESDDEFVPPELQTNANGELLVDYAMLQSTADNRINLLRVVNQEPSLSAKRRKEIEMLIKWNTVLAQPIDGTSQETIDKGVEERKYARRLQNDYKYRLRQQQIMDGQQVPDVIADRIDDLVVKFNFHNRYENENRFIQSTTLRIEEIKRKLGYNEPLDEEERLLAEKRGMIQKLSKKKKQRITTSYLLRLKKILRE